MQMIWRIWFPHWTTNDNGMLKEAEQIGLGGGCHWCTEAVFQNLAGVGKVSQGFIRSDPPHESWSEAIIAAFNPEKIDYAILIEVHLRTHASMSQHKMRGKYRSAIYTFNDHQSALVKNVLERLQPEFDEQLITMVLPHREFKPSDERFQNYYSTNPERPFCRTYIDPKLRMLREQFSEY